MSLWCENQMIDEDNYVICLAHLAEGRALDCPYENNEKRMESEYPCSDYRRVLNEK